VQADHVTAHGDPTVLEVVDLPEPVPGPGEVLVRVLAVSINHLDLFVRRGMPGFPIPFPRIPGCDGIGEIAALGEGVADIQVGRKVVIEPGYTKGSSREVDAGLDHLAADYGIRGEHSDGLDRELVVLERRYVFPLPAGVDPIEGEGSGVSGSSAHPAGDDRRREREARGDHGKRQPLPNGLPRLPQTHIGEPDTSASQQHRQDEHQPTQGIIGTQPTLGPARSARQAGDVDGGLCVTHVRSVARLES
jgi:hypothetical protein